MISYLSKWYAPFLFDLRIAPNLVNVILIGHEHKLRVRFDAELCGILAELFNGLRHPHLHYLAQNEPREPRSRKRECAHRQHPDELDAEVATGCNADRKGAPNAGEQVDRDRAYDVVYLKDLQQFHPADAQHAAHGTNYERPVVIDDIWPGCNGDEAGERAVEDSEQIDAPEEGPR